MVGALDGIGDFGEADMIANLLLRSGLGPLLDACPLCCLDVGSRGGFEPDLLPIAGAVNAIGFEPEPAAYAALAAQPAGPWRSLRHLPHAVAGSDGERCLHVPEDPVGASILAHDPRVAEAFGKGQFTRRVATVPVTTRRLDPILAEAGIDDPVYLKLDVEGAELEILEGAPRALEHLLALKVEVSFLPFRQKQPLARDIDAMLGRHGFQLMDLIEPHRWRVRGYAIAPQSARQAIPYSRGQLVQGDYLFFRQPEAVTDPVARLRLAALSMCYGYFDHAERLLGDPDLLPLLDRCSRAYGRAVWRREALDHLRRIVTFARSRLALAGARP